MNFGLVFHRIWQKLHCWSRHLKIFVHFSLKLLKNSSFSMNEMIWTRRAYCAISLLNYSADLILISWMFSQQPVFLDVLFCISSALIGISITGLYLKRPSVMLPDVIYKVVVSACALFNAILEADNGTSGAAPRLLMVFIALLSHIYENYFLFNAIAAFYREQEGVENRRPPPSYNLFAKSRKLRRFFKLYSPLKNEFQFQNQLKVIVLHLLKNVKLLKIMTWKMVHRRAVLQKNHLQLTSLQWRKSKRKTKKKRRMCWKLYSLLAFLVSRIYLKKGGAFLKILEILKECR
ncbi:Protein CBG26490 [Caenorhabditis briggsae]|uniref:Protein CBG26490 n=1 Tax=Caenorhabditis briggsae TaxID=6238 RepID=B6IH41_CAEBR|nr:Protein CBG26490 [Caenorhabditis briggsae]CAR99221.1 Protein CBG26490 [Caenorhabditis briggsae]